MGWGQAKSQNRLGEAYSMSLGGFWLGLVADGGMAAGTRAAWGSWGWRWCWRTPGFVAPAHVSKCPPVLPHTHPPLRCIIQTHFVYPCTCGTLPHSLSTWCRWCVHAQQARWVLAGGCGGSLQPFGSLGYTMCRCADPCTGGACTCLSCCVRPQERQIGFVFQSYALFSHMTVAENIKFGLEVRRLAVDKDKRVADLLALVQLQVGVGVDGGGLGTQWGPGVACG